MQTHIFLVRALTNQHVGSGDAAYGAVDKLVQKDPTTQLPTIHSTSIKGALREYFEESVGWKHPQHPKKADARVEHIFGSAVGDSDNARQGHYHFFSADLLALAVANEEDGTTETFYRLSSDETLQQFAEKAELLGGFLPKAGKTMLQSALKNAGLEIKTKDLRTLKERSEALPVIARNQLENGISNNLWYEEIVPRETLFGWIVQANGQHEQDFLREIDGKIIQIGANATVGYGFCHFKKIN